MIQDWIGENKVQNSWEAAGAEGVVPVDVCATSQAVFCTSPPKK